MATLSDPVKLYSIAKAALANMQLSSSLADPTRMISIAKALKDTDLSKIAFIQYPTAYVEGYGAVRPTDSAEAVNLALQEDRPVTFTYDNESSSFASAGDPNARVIWASSESRPPASSMSATSTTASSEAAATTDDSWISRVPPAHGASARPPR